MQYNSFIIPTSPTHFNDALNMVASGWIRSILPLFSLANIILSLLFKYLNKDETKLANVANIKWNVPIASAASINHYQN